MDTSTVPETQSPATQPSTSSTSSLPTDWPGAFGLYKYSKAAVKVNLQPLLMLILVSFGASIVLSFLKLPGKILSEIVGMVLSVAWIHTYLAGARGQKIDLSQALQACQPIVVLKYIANAIIVGLALGVSLILLVVPFFFVLPRLMLAPYFLVDQQLGPIEAIKRSWQATRGHAGKIWGIIGANIAMVLLVVTIIGIPFAIYFLFMYGAANALAYDFIVKQTAPVQPTAAPTPLDAPVDATPTVS